MFLAATMFLKGNLSLSFRYSNGIEKALKNFEYSSEWPDLINALGKLSKVIELQINELHQSATHNQDGRK